MNMKNVALFALSNTTVVIDVNGQVRQLLPGEVPGPGEVIVIIGQGATAAVDAQLVEESGEAVDLNVDDEIAAIVSQIEQGVDPTQNDEFATAAGGLQGSSLTGSGDIERIGTESSAQTSFDKFGLESQGLSRTQSLALLDLFAQAIFVGQDDLQSFETDIPLVVTGSVEATNTDIPTFVVQENIAGDFGVFSIDINGNWTYIANSAFDELNVGDSLVDVFPIESADSTIGSVTITINGTNDLPVFVATDDIVISDSEEESITPFAFEDGAYVFDLPENTPAGITLGVVEATDVDNDVLIYSISSNIENEGGDPLFQIDPDTGELSLTDAGEESFANDFELLDNEHQLVVTVTEGDGVGEPQSVDVDVFFNEVNLDDNEPIFTEQNGEEGGYYFTYDENRNSSDVLGTVSASDADGESVTYSIVSNITDDQNAPLFAVNSTNGQITLTQEGVNAFNNDFELDPNVHSIVVRATEVDGLGSAKSTDVSVSLGEVNLDDNVPVFERTNEAGEYQFTYKENIGRGKVIGQVEAKDADGEEVRYHISNNVLDDRSRPLFEIHPVTGEITLTRAGTRAYTNDYELFENSHNIVVTATEVDGLGEIESTNVNVTLNERNKDDNRPEFEDTRPNGKYLFRYRENREEDDVLGQVSASDADGENVTYRISVNVESRNGKALFEIDSDSGEISLTRAGVNSFTNDHEWARNFHNIVVEAVEDRGLGRVKSTEVIVSLKEVNVDDNVPVFENTNRRGNYVFEYPENRDENDVLGRVRANDADGEPVRYAIENNVIGANFEPLFEIHPVTGRITLTEAGVEADSNDYESQLNVHRIVVSATEVAGLGPNRNVSYVNVVLKETNINEAPVAEDISIDHNFVSDEEDVQRNIAQENEEPITTPYGFIPIPFDSDDPNRDHISDQEDDLNRDLLNVVITSLPTSGFLLYTDDMGDTRVLDESDLYDDDIGLEPGKFLNPHNIVYVPAQGEEFVMGQRGNEPVEVSRDGFNNWGDRVNGKEREFELENGSTISINLINRDGQPLRQFDNESFHIGRGIGDRDWFGMNRNEKLVIDFRHNPLMVIAFGLDGMDWAFSSGSPFRVTAIYTLQDGSEQVETYQRPPGDFGRNLMYDFEHSSPDNPIIEMELFSNGGAWELRYIAGHELPTQPDNFDYFAVDSGYEISETKTVALDLENAPQYGLQQAEEESDLEAKLGQDVMVGGDGQDIFVWLDSTLDSGTDVVVNFSLADGDLIDLSDVLTVDEPIGEDDDIDALIDAAIDAEVVGNDVVLTVTGSESEQTIVIKDGVESLSTHIDNGVIANEMDLYAQILKLNDAA